MLLLYCQQLLKKVFFYGPEEVIEEEVIEGGVIEKYFQNRIFVNFYIMITKPNLTKTMVRHVPKPYS